MRQVLANSPVKLHVEVVTNLWNFRAWLDPLGVRPKNITIVEHGEDVNHVFRFLPRSELGNYRVHENPVAWLVRNTMKDWGSVGRGCKQ